MAVSRREFGRMVLPAALSLRSATAFAQAPRSVAQIANYSGADRQSVLEAGARRERSLLLYTTGTQIEPLIAGFERKYPFIKVSLQRETQADIARRVVEEYRAGYKKVDMFELASGGLTVVRDANILEPFRSPEGAVFDSAAIEAGRRWVIVRESYVGIGFNTRQVPPESAPRSYADLLKPQWRGRMAMTGSLSTAANWVGVMLLTEGEDFVRKLAAQNIRIYSLTSRALANLMISGEVALSPTIYNSHVAESTAKGAPLAWIAPGPVSVLDACVALAREAPAPHAAMLLIDYLMSKEGQTAYRALGYGSPRRDMEDAGKAPLQPPQRVYLANRPSYARDFVTWSRLYQDLFLHRRL